MGIELNELVYGCQELNGFIDTVTIVGGKQSMYNVFRNTAFNDVFPILQQELNNCHWTLFYTDDINLFFTEKPARGFFIEDDAVFMIPINSNYFFIGSKLNKTYSFSTIIKLYLRGVNMLCGDNVRNVVNVLNLK